MVLKVADKLGFQGKQRRDMCGEIIDFYELWEVGLILWPQKRGMDDGRLEEGCGGI
jgi:hypothetical protein